MNTYDHVLRLMRQQKASSLRSNKNFVTGQARPRQAVIGTLSECCYSTGSPNTVRRGIIAKRVLCLSTIHRGDALVDNCN